MFDNVTAPSGSFTVLVSVLANPTSPLASAVVMGRMTREGVPTVGLLNGPTGNPENTTWQVHNCK